MRVGHACSVCSIISCCAWVIHPGSATNKSSEISSIETVHTIRTHLDAGKNVLGLYLDLKKAFDTVDHSILLKKLYHYGVRGMAHNILASYLHNRKQCTYVNGTFSNYLNINTGVPQGSVLGPLLFLVYVNDINRAVPNVSTRLFADDTNVFFHDNDCKRLIDKGIQSLTQLKNWFDCNKLTLHLGKTNYVIFHAKDSSHSCYDEFNFNGVTISKSSSTKYLGLLIDDKLSWSNHINELCNSLVKYIGIFYNLRGILSETIATQIYYSFIYSKLRYAIEIYGTAKVSYLRPLQVLQNRLIKQLTNKPRRYPTDLLYRENNLLKIKEIHSYCMCGLLYNHCNNNLPNAISQVISHSNVTDCFMLTRNNNLFKVTRHNSHHGKLLLNNYGYNLWQPLPNSIKSAKSLKSFQSKLKDNLINNYM